MAKHKREDRTYRWLLESIIEMMQDNLKNDTHDWTSKYAEARLLLAHDYLDEARKKIQ